jgi:hypothetical protein
VARYYLAFLLLFVFQSCDNNFENVIDDPNIIGTWHRYSYTEAGVEYQESDSIVYHFINDGRLIIKYFSDTGASPPDENYEVDLQEGILRYWNADYNVSEAKEVNLTESTLRIKMYSNLYYNLKKLF